ncbi:MAG: cytochrome c-type biogenesis protein CcmE [Cycloclasticus sp.]|jgi:cytochrome c-type biogenesis protein CcmE|tara:strand:- start:2661 stop:3107 length:447 start_codon:yes stop_codon:yes gene_type:complete
MNNKRKKRLLFIILLVSGVAISATLALQSFNENLMYFYPPSDIKAGKAPVDHLFRVGGLVVENSLKRENDSLTLEFLLTDQANTIKVRYTGILPDLFREGQGIIARGKLDAKGVFIAEEVLAKHDENYMPPEVADSLKSNHNKVSNDS